MNRFIIGFLTILISASLIFAGTSGKIAGQVVDANTKEPLVGANVIVEGTYLGASTDVDGDYYIINVPVGTHTLVVSYIGYKTVKYPGVKVILDQTTPVNFELTEDIAEGEAIVVTADAFKVQKDETTKKITIQKEDIQAMPVQDLSAMIAAQAGVIQIESSVQQIAGFEDRGIEEIHVRGGRSGEIGYTIDGMYITNPFYGHRYKYTELNQFAIEQMDIKTGVFDAEYGGAMSSMINIITRDGGDKLEGNLRIQNSNPGRLLDPWNYFSTVKDAPADLAPEQDVLRDHREISGGFGGPVPFTNKRMRFIVTGHKMNRAFRVYEFDDRTFNPDEPQDSQNNDFLNQLDTLAGWRDMGFLRTWDIYGKLSWRLANTMKLDFSVWNLQALFRSANLSNSAYQFYEEGRNINTQSSDRQALMFNHQLSKSIFYDVRISRFYQKMFIGVTDNGKPNGNYLDPDEYERPMPDTDWENNPYAFEYYIDGHDRYYHKNFAETYESFFNLLAQATKHHQIKFGASYRRHTIMIDELQLPWLLTPYTEKYTKHPEEASIYLQDLIEYDYMTIHLGLRFDALNTNDAYWTNPYADPENRELVETDWEYTVSPRIGFSHVITDNATFTFGYGKFTQTPTYRNKYINEERDLTTPRPILGNAGLNMEQMTAYEFGLNVGIGNNVIAQLIGWSKEYSNLTSSERIPQFPYSFTTLLNTDYATARGVDVVVQQRMRNSYMLLQYTYSRATANRKDPWEGYRSTHTERTMPKREILMNYDRTHDLNLTYSLSIPGNTGPKLFGYNFLEKTHYNLIFNAVSGWPYTPVVGNVAGETNSERGPWNYYAHLNFRRFFHLYGVRIKLGVVVQNLFDWKNEIDIWPTTGNADDPGPRLNQLIEDGWYSQTLFDRPYMYSMRRRINFSLEFEL